MRLLLALVLLGLTTTLATTPQPAVASPSGPGVEEALAVLHRWDARRAAAWARTDPAALRRLYVTGSTAAEADVRLLGRWTARGLVVRRLRTQVFSVSVLHSSGRLLRIRLLDRVAGGEAYDGHHAMRLPVSRPVFRIVELRRANGAWRVAAVRRVSASGPAPPPAPHGRRRR